MVITTAKGTKGRNVSKVQESLSIQCVLWLGSSPGGPRPGCSLGPGSDPNLSPCLYPSLGTACRPPSPPRPRPTSPDQGTGSRLGRPARTLPQGPPLHSPVPWNLCQTHTRFTVSPRWNAQVQATMCVSSHSHGCPCRKRSALPDTWCSEGPEPCHGFLGAKAGRVSGRPWVCAWNTRRPGGAPR